MVAILLKGFPAISQNINNSLESGASKIFGERIADSNIVIIGINEDDIAKLGGWPLKRSYYALLLKRLSKYEPKKIGMEVFLSKKSAGQNLYNELLKEVAGENENILFASVLSDIGEDDGLFYSDSILFPSVELKTNRTAHINYLEFDGVYIPKTVRYKDATYSSFSYALTGEKNGFGLAKVNFNKSWKRYKSYSLIEFISLSENGKELDLNNKIVLMGVTDPSIARGIETIFDGRIPGVGIHAMAIDNMLNNELLSYEGKDFSFWIFILLVLILTDVLLSRKYKWIYILANVLLLIVAIALYLIGNTETYYSALLLPFVCVIFFEGILSFLTTKYSLEKSLSDKATLALMLEKKEARLEEMKLEFSNKEGEEKQQYENELNKLQIEIERLKSAQIDEEPVSTDENEIVKEFHGIIYSDSSMDKVVRLIEKVAPTEATVLIEGESGSGKELVARAIHDLSLRKGKNFMAINCAALSDSLLESELFGHEKGAFTNAIADKKGLFEAADGGTIFLDEIGETSEAFQVKILRVLQNGEIQKVGSNEFKKVDVRVVTATNKNLSEMVKEKTFREDLYYRLNVVKLSLPPLRDREGDIVLLAKYFAEAEGVALTNGVVTNLRKHNWKGNVRELQGVVKRGAIFATAEGRKAISIVDLPDGLGKVDKNDIEELILASLREKKFSHKAITQTAEELGGLSRTVISENLRGAFFREYCINNFDKESANHMLAGDSDPEVLERVKSKTDKFLNNIERDVRKYDSSDFEEIRRSVESKYKNLPQRYHEYLDQIIKEFIKMPGE